MTDSASVLVRLQDVRYSYIDGGQTHPVLAGIDFHIARSERVALLGASGSGKSTLLNLIAGIEPPDSGRIWVAGTELSGMGEPAITLFRRRHIGFVYQFFNLLPTLTAMENIRLSRELNGASAAEARRLAKSLLQRVGMADRADAFPEQLSGGEQQRVAIARALAQRPALILADEPTGSLDAKAGELVLQVLDEAVRQDGTGLLMVTHSEQVAAFAQRTLYLHEGRVKCG